MSLLPFVFRRDLTRPLDSPELDGNNDAIEERYTLADAAATNATTSETNAAASASSASTSATNAASSASSASTSAANASDSATLAAAWAEGAEPGGAGTKSAKGWAADAEAAAASVLDNPMTAADDMIIGGVNGDPQRLPGVTATGKSVLTGNEAQGRQALGLGSAGAQSGFRNSIINGNFDVWQRGTSFGTSGLTADRWNSSVGGSGGVQTVSRQSFVVGQTDVPGEPEFFLRCERTTAGTAFSDFLQQRIENVRTFAGQTVTCSFYAKAGAAKTIKVRLLQNFGSGGSATVTATANEPISLTTVWQKFSLTFSVASITGKTIGSNSYITLNFLEDEGFSLFTLDIASVQLERGSAASAFEMRPLATELALCQRYYYRENTGGITGQPHTGTFQSISTTVARGVFRFPVPMRVRPTALEQSGVASDWVITHGGADHVLSTVPVWYAATQFAGLVNVSVSSGLTAGDAGYLRSGSGADTYLAWSAEL